MKKLFYLLLPAWFAAATMPLMGQTCASGYCPGSITVEHVQGKVSPQTITITYPVVSNSASGSPVCWLYQNLGASTAPTAYNDATATAAGWYWQWGFAQGYYFATATGGLTYPLTENTTAATTSAGATWPATTDPCTLLLGTAGSNSWHVPSKTDWNYIYTAYSSTFAAGYYSALKLHMAGGMTMSGGVHQVNPGNPNGVYWSGTGANSNSGYDLGFNTNTVWATTDFTNSLYGFPIRCCRLP